MSSKSLKRSGRRGYKVHTRHQRSNDTVVVLSEDTSTESENDNKSKTSRGKTERNSNRNTRTLRSRQTKSFRLPSRREVWDKIVNIPHSGGSLDQYRPRKIVNNFVTGASRYNYDPAYTSGEDSIKDFVVDDDEVEYGDCNSLSSDSSSLSTGSGKGSRSTTSDSSSSIGSDKNKYSDEDNIHDKNCDENGNSSIGGDRKDKPVCDNNSDGNDSIRNDGDSNIIQCEKSRNKKKIDNVQTDDHQKVTSASCLTDDVGSSSLHTSSCESDLVSDGSSNEYKKRFRCCGDDDDDDDDSMVHVILLQSDSKSGNPQKSSNKGDNCSPFPTKAALSIGCGKELGSSVTPTMATDELPLHTEISSDKGILNTQRKRRKLKCSRPRKQRRTDSLSSSLDSDSSQSSHAENLDSDTFSKEGFMSKLRRGQKAKVTKRLFSELRERRQKQKIQK